MQDKISIYENDDELKVRTPIKHKLSEIMDFDNIMPRHFERIEDYHRKKEDIRSIYDNEKTEVGIKNGINVNHELVPDSLLNFEEESLSTDLDIQEFKPAPEQAPEQEYEQEYELEQELDNTQAQKPVTSEFQTYITELRKLNLEINEEKLQKISEVNQVVEKLHEFLGEYIVTSKENEKNLMNYQHNFYNDLSQLIQKHKESYESYNTDSGLISKNQHERLIFDFNNLILNFSSLTDELKELSFKEQELMNNIQNVILDQMSRISSSKDRAVIDFSKSQEWLTEQHLGLQAELAHWKEQVTEELAKQREQLKMKQDLILEIETRNKDLENELKSKLNDYENRSKELESAHSLLNERENKLKQIWDDIRVKLEILDTKTEEFDSKSKMLESQNISLNEKKNELELETTNLEDMKKMLIEENKKIEENLRKREEELESKRMELVRANKTIDNLKFESKDKEHEFIEKLKDEWDKLNVEKNKLFIQKKKLSDEIEEKQKNLDDEWKRIIEDKNRFEQYIENKTKELNEQSETLKLDINDLYQQKIKLEAENKIIQNDIIQKQKELVKFENKVVDEKNGMGNTASSTMLSKAEMENKLRLELRDEIEKSIKTELKERLLEEVQKEFETERMDVETEKSKLAEKDRMLEKQQTEFVKIKDRLEKNQKELDIKLNEISNIEKKMETKNNELLLKEKKLNHLEEELKIKLEFFEKDISKLEDLENQINVDKRALDQEKKRLEKKEAELKEKALTFSKQDSKSKEDTTNLETAFVDEKPRYKEELEIILNQPEKKRIKKLKK